MVSGAGLLALRAGSLRSISHDDGISYIAATGHQSEYALQPPAGAWVQAREWKRLWKPETFGCFRAIRDGLANYDIHPPLYFWMLHLWTFCRGTELTSGPSLNVLIQVFTAPWIYKAVLLGGGGPWSGVLAAHLWLFSESTLSVANETRPYSLIGWLTAALLTGTLFFLRDRSKSALAMIFMVSLGGLLTHYHFMLVIAAVMAGAGIILTRQKKPLTLVPLFLCVLGALVVFICIHPGFLHSFTIQNEAAQPFSKAMAGPRAIRILTACMEFFMLQKFAGPVAVWMGSHGVTALIVIIVLIIIIFRNSVLSGNDVSLTNSILAESRLPVICVLILLPVISVLYIAHLSPWHAMGGKYLMFVSPIVFISVCLIIDRFLRSQKHPVLLVVLLMAYQCGSGGWATYRFIQRQASFAPAQLDRATSIMLDSIERGVLPRLLWSVPYSTDVFAARQYDLGNDFPTIPVSVGRLGYISSTEYDYSPLWREAIISHIGKQGFQQVRSSELRPVRGTIFFFERDGMPAVRFIDDQKRPLMDAAP